MLSSVRVLDLIQCFGRPILLSPTGTHGRGNHQSEAVGRGDWRHLGADKQLSDAQMGISFLAQNAGKNL